MFDIAPPMIPLCLPKMITLHSGIPNPKGTQNYLRESKMEGILMFRLKKKREWFSDEMDMLASLLRIESCMAVA